mgnify:CR=1 FL=1
MNNFPAAEEAFAETNRYTGCEALRQIRELKRQIRLAVNDRKYAITGEGTLDEYVVHLLRKNNYKVILDSQYNQSYWIISWDLRK